jgi:hypothetical protein
MHATKEQPTISQTGGQDGYAMDSTAMAAMGEQLEPSDEADEEVDPKLTPERGHGAFQTLCHQENHALDATHYGTRRCVIPKAGEASKTLFKQATLHHQPNK